MSFQDQGSVRVNDAEYAYERVAENRFRLKDGGTLSYLPKHDLWELSRMTIVFKIVTEGYEYYRRLLDGSDSKDVDLSKINKRDRRISYYRTLNLPFDERD